MSEAILKALMQLFAIIARPDSTIDVRRSVVKSFISDQLNKEIAEEYLGTYDEFVRKFADEDAKRSKGTKRSNDIERLIARRSVRVIKICSELNEELALHQRITILVQLLEFIRSDSEHATDQEMKYLILAAQTFNLVADEYEAIINFVTKNTELDTSPFYLIINDSVSPEKDSGKNNTIVRDNLNGQVRVMFIPSTNMYLIKSLGNTELFINGQLLYNQKTYTLNTGSSIRNNQIKPIYYSDIVRSFVEDRVKSKIVFQAEHISYKFPSGDIGLRDINFTETSGRLVGIMGASGAGKSTLLNVLNGTNQPTEGSVLINGINIHSDDPAVNGIVGFVSQDDLLIEELTVYQNLYYNAKLCFDNYSEEQLEETVNNVLKNLGLYEIRNIQVGSPLNKKISGGQRKRLNIALELIREPAVLFLDEPTSGLSSRDSENILDLLKELSLKGKLVFVVIHQPSSDIFKMFDRLLILDTGGYLIYNGNPIDSIQYFKKRAHYADFYKSECQECGNVNPEQVFNIVETSVLDEYGKLTHTRRIPPEEWSKMFNEGYEENEQPEAAREDLPEINFKTPERFNQFKVFLKRDILKKLSDTQYLIINLLEAPILAFLLAFIVKYFDEGVGNIGYTLSENSNLPVYIFMSVIVAIFMGLSVSAEEIIKDRKILKREAFLNLSWSGYLMSKVAVQLLLAAVQSATFVLIGNSIMEIKGMYLEYWIVLFSAWASANLLGLLISDSFKTVVTIYILIPFLVIPQIILSGIIVKFENLNPMVSSPDKIPFYGEIITARWAYEGLATYQYMENDYQKQFYEAEKKKSVAEFKSSFLIKDLQKKMATVSQEYKNPEKKELIEAYLTLIRNEIDKEFETRQIFRSYCPEMPNWKMKNTDQLTLNKINDAVIEYTLEYLASLKEEYTKIFKSAFIESNDIKEEFNIDELQDLKSKYHNISLEEFVTDKNEFKKIVEFKGKLIQKTDPIYLDPVHKFVKAHFYAPRKMVFGIFVPTIWVNVIVIWIMTILIYVALYFRILKRFLEKMENISSKRKH